MNLKVNAIKITNHTLPADAQNDNSSNMGNFNTHEFNEAVNWMMPLTVKNGFKGHYFNDPSKLTPPLK